MEHPQPDVPMTPEQMLQALFDRLNAMQAHVDGQQNQIVAMQAAQAQATFMQTVGPAPAAVPYPADRLKPKAPPTYSGLNDTARLDNFLFLFDLYVQSPRFGAVSDEEKIRTAATFLTESAQVWYRSMCEKAGNPASCVPFSSYQDFTQAIKLQFAEVNAHKRARDRLAALRQDTTVRVYIDRFTGICLEIEDLSTAERLDKFVRGLNKDIRREVELRSSNAPIDEVMQMADRLCILSSTYGSRNHMHTSASKTFFPAKLRSAGPTPMDLGSVQVPDEEFDLDAIQSSVPRAKLTDAERDRLRATGGCFYCRKTGHMIADCPLKKKGPNVAGRR